MVYNQIPFSKLLGVEQGTLSKLENDKMAMFAGVVFKIYKYADKAQFERILEHYSKVKQ